MACALCWVVGFINKVNMSAGMKQSKDPFEVAFEEQEESPPESPNSLNETESQHPSAVVNAKNGKEDTDPNRTTNSSNPPKTSQASSVPSETVGPSGKAKEDDDEEEDDENMDVEQLGKYPTSGDPDKMSKMQAILSQFTEEQMSRYESFRRSGFQKANMKRLLASVSGSNKISAPMTIVVSGIAKMFVGELIETARMVMTERKENGPIRPCHIREAYRRLKLENKVPRRSVQRLFC